MTANFQEGCFADDRSDSDLSSRLSFRYGAPDDFSVCYECSHREMRQGRILLQVRGYFMRRFGQSAEPEPEWKRDRQSEAWHEIDGGAKIVTPPIHSAHNASLGGRLLDLNREGAVCLGTLAGCLHLLSIGKEPGFRASRSLPQRRRNHYHPGLKNLSLLGKTRRKHCGREYDSLKKRSTNRLRGEAHR